MVGESGAAAEGAHTDDDGERAAAVTALPELCGLTRLRAPPFIVGRGDTEAHAYDSVDRRHKAPPLPSLPSVTISLTGDLHGTRHHAGRTRQLPRSVSAVLSIVLPLPHLPRLPLPSRVYPPSCALVFSSADVRPRPYCIAGGSRPVPCSDPTACTPPPLVPSLPSPPPSLPPSPPPHLPTLGRRAPLPPGSMPLPGSVIHRSKVALTSKRRAAASQRAADPDLVARVAAFEALERSMPAVMTAAAANQAHWEAVASSGLAFSVALRNLYAGRAASPAAPADFGVPEGGARGGSGARPAAGAPATDSRSSVDSYGSSAQGGGAAGAVALNDHAARVLNPSLEVAATAMAGSGSSPSSTPVVLATTASRLASAFMEDVARTRELLTALHKERVEEDYYEAKVAELLATPGGAGSSSGPRRVPAAAAGSASAVKKAERRAEKLAGNVKKRAEHGRTAVRLRDQAVAAIGRLLAARDPLLDRLLSSFVAAQAARLRDPSYGGMAETVRGRWPHLLSLPPGDGGLAALRQQHFAIHGVGGGGGGRPPTDGGWRGGRPAAPQAASFADPASVPSDRTSVPVPSSASYSASVAVSPALPPRETPAIRSPSAPSSGVTKAARPPVVGVTKVGPSRFAPSADSVPPLRPAPAREVLADRSPSRESPPPAPEPVHEPRPSGHVPDPAYYTYASTAPGGPSDDSRYAGSTSAANYYGDDATGGAEIVEYGGGRGDDYVGDSGDGSGGGGDGGRGGGDGGSRWSDARSSTPSGGSHPYAHMSALDRRYREMLDERGLDATVEGDEAWLRCVPPTRFDGSSSPSAPPGAWRDAAPLN